MLIELAVGKGMKTDRHSVRDYDLYSPKTFTIRFF
jgi:hypothetical protein